METIETRCCIAGGGPAGMMAGYLLARAGIAVQVLEKHADFLRDFRGDTIHPSTLQVMAELGLLEDLLQLPHRTVPYLEGQIGDFTVRMADFRHLPVRCPFIALMPQWDFLNFLAERGRRYAGFGLRMQTDVRGLIIEGDTVRGVIAETPAGPLQIRADLVIGADGRHSTVRDKAGFQAESLGAPMDVLWFSLPRQPDDGGQTGGRFDPGRIFVLIDRGDHWQCGYVITKGSIDAIRTAGLEAFREDVAARLPFDKARADAIQSWDDVKLLTVTIDRLKEWCRPGLLCIGDSAHAMSPIGGVGINLAIQDAVATANLLAGPLRAGPPTLDDLRRVQRRRALPAKLTQAAQLLVQKRVVSQVLTQGDAPIQPNWFIRLFNHVPLLQRIPARMVGMGFRPEHVRVPETRTQAA